MDNFARALLAAERILEESQYVDLRKARYASFDSGKGQAFEQKKMSLSDLADYANTQGEPAQNSGRQEIFENIINRYI